jgi:dihydrofolate reductase
MTWQPKIELSLIAAVSEDGVIGTGHGGIPWRLPRDSAHFRDSVAGKAILLGRKTYDEMAAWFRNERPIILTSDHSFQPRERETRVAHSLEEALRISSFEGNSEIMVCGGASVYRQTLPLASRMILTHVETRLGATYPAARRFPVFDPALWMKEREESYPADDENSRAMRIAWYRRAKEHRRHPSRPNPFNAGSAGNR